MASKTDRSVERIHAGTRQKLRGALISSDDAARMLEEAPASAEQRARQILKLKPGNRTALLLLGAALRRQGCVAAAKEILKQLVESRPQFSIAQFELGLALSSLGESSDSIAAFLQAVDFHPGMMEAWYELGGSLARHSNCDCGVAGEEFPKRNFRLQKSEAALRAGDLDLAERLLNELLTVSPADVQAIKLLADTLLRAKRLPAAESHLARCVRLAPHFQAARFSYATVLFASLDFEGALQQTDDLLCQEPTNALFRYLRATLLNRMNAFDRAALEYEAVLANEPNRAGVWVGYARALKVLGRDRECIAAFKKAIQLVPSFGEAYRQLASVKTFRFDADMTNSLRFQLSLPSLLGVDRAPLHFALAKALEDAGQYAEAFENYLLSNMFQRKTIEYSAQANFEKVQFIKSAFTPQFSRLRSGTGSEALGPIFIVGMPRAGSTLIEQILCSHSAIEALGEIQSLSHVADKARHSSSVDGKVLCSLADEYLQLAGRRRKLGRPFFTDKMPGNFFHAGLICLMFPNAKIIDARRNPLDCCSSCFTNFFPYSQPFASDLVELGRYYVDYVELMAHFDQVFPGRIHRAVYEDLVEDPEREVRRLLKYLALPFEDACLRFYETDRDVKTMSAEQVRLPLYRHGMGQWRKFEPWLTPLKEALGSVLEVYPAVPKFCRSITNGDGSRVDLGTRPRRLIVADVQP